MKTKTLNTFQALAPVLTQTAIKPQYRPRYNQTLLPIQKLAYDKLLHGLRAFPVEEVRAMNEEQKRSVIYSTNLAWTIINRMKQMRLNAFLGNILGKVFGNDLCGNAVPFLLAPICDNNFQVNSELKECVVPQRQIIEAFIKNRLLPVNFLG